MFKKIQSGGQFDSSYDQNTCYARIPCTVKLGWITLFSFRNVFSLCSVPEHSVLPVSMITSP